MITTFLFDLGGVLFTNGTKQFIKRICDTYSISEATVKDVIDGELGSLYRESKITRDEFWRSVINKLNLKEDVNTLEQQWIDGYDLVLKTKKIIERLSKHYKVYYLSDNIKERVDALDKKFNFLKLFRGGIFSHEVGIRKPNPKIYEFALKKSNSKPEETIFIDDKQKFLDSAIKIGIKSILFTTPEGLERIFLEEKFI